MTSENVTVLNAGTVCKCGSAKSYHQPADQRDHAYEPKYDPFTWAEGVKAGRAAERAASTARIEALEAALRGVIDDVARGSTLYCNLCGVRPDQDHRADCPAAVAMRSLNESEPHRG